MSATSATPSWWHRNWRSLLALGVLAVLTPTVVVGNSVRRRQNTEPRDAIVVEAGEATEYGSATVGPVSAAFGTDEDAPAGTRVVKATVVLNDASSLTCNSPTLTETDGARRKFGSTYLLASTDELGLPDDCLGVGSDADELSLTYLIPDDATGPFVIEFVSPDELPTYIMFKVQP